MKKQYKKAFAKIVFFQKNDMITTSGLVATGDNFIDDELFS